MSQNYIPTNSEHKFYKAGIENQLPIAFELGGSLIWETPVIITDWEPADFE